MPPLEAFRRIPRIALVPLAVALLAAADDARPGIFRITPLRPVAELRALALATTPPPESGPFRPVELLELTALDPTIRLDIRYATDDNFLSTPVYAGWREYPILNLPFDQIGRPQTDARAPREPW
jgi:D-alanyl-D-alanine dipeptidase